MKQLTFGAIVLAYKQEDYISYCLRALAEHVDLIVVLFSTVPWIAYNPRAREEFTDSDDTRQLLDVLGQELPNVSVIEGVWDNEEDMRNEGLKVLRDRGIQVCLVVDADEFYPEGGLEALKKEIRYHDTPGTTYLSAHRTCYKRFDYIVDSSHQVHVAVHIDSSTTFYRRRGASGTEKRLPEEIFFWHMGYVLSNERMWEKIHTFGHANELVPGWFDEKWLNWTPYTRDLFRKNPSSRWPRTIKIQPAMLPRILHGHPYFPDRTGENEALVVSGQTNIRMPQSEGFARSMSLVRDLSFSTGND